MRNVSLWPNIAFQSLNVVLWLVQVSALEPKNP